MEFITGNKKTRILVLNNYHFHKLKEIKVSTTWPCAFYEKFKCNTTATTVDDQLTSVRNEHNHDLTIGKVEAKKFHGQVKTNAQEKTATVAIADALTGIDENDHSTMLALQAKNCQARTANRARQKCRL